MKKFAYLLFLVIYLNPLHVFGHCKLLTQLTDTTLFPGDSLILEWTIEIEHEQENWDLYYSADNGLNWSIIKEDMPVAQLNYLWIVPDIDSDSMLIKIVQDNLNFDYEDRSGHFTINGTTTSTVSSNSGLDLNLYPNPVIDQVYIQYNTIRKEEIHMDLINEQGQIILANDWRGQEELNNNPITISMKDYPDGLYYIRLRQNNQPVIKPLFKGH